MSQSDDGLLLVSGGKVRERARRSAPGSSTRPRRLSAGPPNGPESGRRSLSAGPARPPPSQGGAV